MFRPNMCCEVEPEKEKQKKKEELIPCPFCGKSVAEHTTIQDCEMCANFEDEEMCPEYECCGHGHFVACNVNKGGCGASTGWYQTPEEATEAWNRRARS